MRITSIALHCSFYFGIQESAILIVGSDSIAILRKPPRRIRCARTKLESHRSSELCVGNVVVSDDVHIANHGLGAFFDGEDGVNLGIVSDGLRVDLDFFKSPVAIKRFEIGDTLLQQFPG